MVITIVTTIEANIMSEYYELVLQLINQATMPLDTEFIRKTLEIPNWTTANRILLELALEGKIIAEKTSKSWIFRKKNGEDRK